MRVVCNCVTKFLTLIKSSDAFALHGILGLVWLAAQLSLCIHSNAVLHDKYAIIPYFNGDGMLGLVCSSLFLFAANIGLGFAGLCSPLSCMTCAHTVFWFLWLPWTVVATIPTIGSVVINSEFLLQRNKAALLHEDPSPSAVWVWQTSCIVVIAFMCAVVDFVLSIASVCAQPEPEGKAPETNGVKKYIRLEEPVERLIECAVVVEDKDGGKLTTVKYFLPSRKGKSTVQSTETVYGTDS